MLVRLRLVGTGVDGDEFRPRFPSFRVVTVDYANMRCVVEIPNRVAPDEHDAPGTPLMPIINGQPVLIGLRAAQRLAWWAKLRRQFDRIQDRIDPDQVV
jgi:hypothetical protein